MDATAARRKAKALIAQATDDAVTPEEARSFALKAAKLIDEHDLLDEILPAVATQVLTPEVGEAVGAVVDLVGRFSKIGIVDSLKRVAGSTKRAAESTRRRKRAHVDVDGRRR